MQIKTIPFNLPFLPVLAEYIAEKHKKISPDFSSLLIVFPSERNKVYFREYLLKETEKDGIIPPALLTIAQLYEYVFEKAGGAKHVLPEEIERNILLKEAVKKARPVRNNTSRRNVGNISNGIDAKNWEDLPAQFWQAGLPFIKFISIGRKLLGLFDELAGWNLTIGKIEKVKETLHFPSQYIDEELPILRKIHKRYKTILEEQGLIDTASFYDSVAEKFKQEYLKEFEYIYFSGFLALTATDASFIKKILTTLPSELILHCDKNKLKDDSLDNVFYHHNKILKLLGADAGKIGTIAPGTLKKSTPTRVYIQKNKRILDEISFIIDTISNLSPRYPLQRIGVILPEESFYLPLTDAMEKFNIPFNLSMGIPFKHSMLYSFLKSASELIDSGFKSKQFLILIQNPIIKGIIKDKKAFRELVYKLDRHIREANFSYINRGSRYPETQAPSRPPLKQWRTGSGQVLIDYIFAVTDKLSQNCTFGKYVKDVREIIQELAEMNEDFAGQNTAVLAGVIDKLITIENSKIPDELCPKGKDKLRFLMNILEGITFPTSGDFARGIQVIGILEARNIDFDCIIIPSCNEGIFPKESEKDLFIPANLRKELGLPYYKEREALYSYYFHQLITGKKEVYISYRMEEDTELGLRSRWVEGLAEAEDNNLIVEESKRTAANIFMNRKGKKTKNPSPIQKDAGTLKTLATFTFSPLMLKTYKQCAYKFYLSYILKMKPPKTIVEEYDASLWGVILHNTFARLYNELYPEGYGKNIKRKVMKNLLKIGKEEFKKIYPSPKASLQFEWEINEKRLADFVDKEIRRFNEGFIPMKLEAELKPYTITIGNGLKIKLGGVPDRIDAKPSTNKTAGRPSINKTEGRDEKFYIIDYKIGKKPPAKTYKTGKDFVEFQLPLYALIFTQGNTDKIGGLIYYHLDDNRRNFLTLDILQKEGINYMERFKEEILLPVLLNIFDAKSPFKLTEDFDTCQRCIFADHCRRV